MEIGFNYPWSYNREGGDVGPNPHVDPTQWRKEQDLVNQGKAASVPLPPLFDHLDRNLTNLRAMGITVVRFFLLGNGFNYAGSGPSQRGTPSPNPGVPYYDWRFFPPFKSDPRFALHFSELLKRFKKAGMKIIPSLLDFWFAGNSRARDKIGLAPGGRVDCMKDDNARSVFFQTMLNDLLKISSARENKDLIFAWEVINEPYWNCSPFGPLSQRPPNFSGSGPDPPSLTGIARWPEISVDEMNKFLTEATQAIESNGFASTVGHRFFQDIYDRQSQQSVFVTGTKPQFHYYAKHAGPFGDPPQIKGEDLFTPHIIKSNKGPSSEPKPFLGEFDSDLNRFGKTWPELSKDTTLERLTLLKSEQCDLALIWPDLGAGGHTDEQDRVVRDDPIKLTAATRSAITDFTGGKLPPANE